MSAFERETVDVWKWHSFFVEIGLFLSLLILVSALQVEWSTTKGFEESDPPPPERITVKDITRTQQQRETPPPPTPTPSVVLPTNEIVEGEEITYDETIDVTVEQDGKEMPPPPESDEEGRNEPFVTVEQPPTLVGGMEALYESVDYPAFAKETGIEGRVIVQFVVDEEGNVQDPTILKGSHELLNEAAIEAVKKQTFTPGRQRGRAVPVRMKLPVNFQLQ